MDEGEMRRALEKLAEDPQVKYAHAIRVLIADVDQEYLGPERKPVFSDALEAHITELVGRLAPVIEAEDRALRLAVLLDKANNEFAVGSDAPSTSAEMARLKDEAPDARKKAGELRESHADDLASLAFWIKRREP